MLTRLMNAENILYGVSVVLVLLYVFLGVKYPVLELEGPLYLLLSMLLAGCISFVVAAKRAGQSVVKAGSVGATLGSIIALVLFISNFLVSAQYVGSYTVLNVKIGRGSSVNWFVQIPERGTVQLNVRLPEVQIGTLPDTVRLKLMRGWLGYYYGDKA